MSDYRIRLACGYYDRTSAIVHGLVRPSGVDLEVVAMNDTARMFSGMFRGEYDASEMSLAELVYYASRGKNDFIGIPVFPSRVFRHGFIYYNACPTSIALRTWRERRSDFHAWFRLQVSGFEGYS